MLSFKLLARVGLRAHLTDEETEAQPSLRSHSWCTDSHSCCTRLLLPSLSGSSRTRRRPWSRLCLPGHWQNHLLWVHSELLLLFFKLVLMDQESHTPILTPPHSPEAIDMGAGGGGGACPRSCPCRLFLRIYVHIDATVTAQACGRKPSEIHCSVVVKTGLRFCRSVLVSIPSVKLWMKGAFGNKSRGKSSCC